MWRVLDNLFLGDRDDAQDRVRLKQRGITHVLNCAEEQPCCFPADLVYLHLDLKDPDVRFAPLLPSIVEFIDTGRKGGGVLVHCSGGVSRSAAAVLAYLCHLGEPLDEAARRLSRQVLTSPDPVFLDQLARQLGQRLSRQEIEQLSLILVGRTD